MEIQHDHIYNAVISFVAEDKSHGYVILIEKPGDLKPKYIFDKQKPSYKFHPVKDTEPEKWQIVEVKVSHKKQFKLASITRNTYVGLKNDNDGVKPVGEFLRSLDILETRSLEQEFIALESNSPVDYFLYYNEIRKHLVAKDPAAVESEKSFYEELKLDFTYHTNQINSRGIVKAGEISSLLLKDDSGKLLVQFQLKLLISQLEVKQNDILSKLFLSTFGAIVPELLDSESWLRLIGGDSVNFIKIWLKDELPDKMLESKSIPKWNTEQDLFAKLEIDEFCEFFFRIRNFPNYTYLLESGLRSIENIPEEYLGDLTRLVNFSINQDVLRDLLYNNLSFECLLGLWRAEEIKDIPAHLWNENFDALKEQDRLKLLQQINWETFIDYTGNNLESSPVIIENFFEHFKTTIKEKINYCCFDLEFNPRTKKIDEVAWCSNGEIFEELDPSPENILQLKNAIENADLVIGHNIKKFDLEKLYGDEIPDLVIWDSLEIEALIRPNAHSLALDTEHEALEDVENTLNLFYYQLYRLLDDKELKNAVINLYGYNFLNAEKESLSYLSIKNELIEKPVKKLFHSEVSEINNVVRSMIPKPASLIICPETSWGHFRDDPNYLFVEEDHFYNLILDRTKWENKLSSLPFLSACLASFHRLYEKAKQKPYARLLSSYVVQQIQEYFPLDQICVRSEELSGKIITSEWYFEKNSEALLEGRSENKIVQLGTDLWPFTSKRKFAEFSQEELSKTEEGSSLWVRFSNGRSYAPISKKMARNLVKNVPGEHFWIEKEALDKYNLWGSNAGKINKNFTQVEISSYYQKKSGLKNQAAKYVKYTNNARSQLLDLNPETLYRDKYWDTKLKTLIHLLGGDRTDFRMCVLLVSRIEEVEIVSEIIRSLGTRFTPSLKSTLRRRLERLIEEEEGIMVVAMEDFEKLLSFPSNKGVLYVMESLSPEELIQISGAGRENKLRSTSVEEEESDSENEGVELPHLASITDSITKLNKYYDWMLFRLVLQHPGNELLVLDPRANYKLFDNFSCKPLPVDFNKIEEGKSREFEIITSRTQSLLYAPREFEYGNLQEHLDRISAALIDGYPFKPEQKAYLDIIFPALEDVLVTLPTGVGKSVLFQGPALYRSSFTGKMSIVVTPLKALMEDHVMGLWKKGFWNAVEYINADKGSEVQDIYRKIAGGQLLMVFVTPERFRSKGFIKALEQRMKIDGGLEYFVFDEAHCISQWGSEFRPDYFYCAQRIKQIRKTYKSPLLLLSATVTKQVASHLEQALYEEV